MASLEARVTMLEQVLSVPSGNSAQAATVGDDVVDALRKRVAELEKKVAAQDYRIKHLVGAVDAAKYPQAVAEEE